MSSCRTRRAALCKAIRLAYDSLCTHFSDSITSPQKGGEYRGNIHFNAKAIREYAEIILICAVELEAIAPRRHKKRKIG